MAELIWNNRYNSHDWAGISRVYVETCKPHLQLFCTPPNLWGSAALVGCRFPYYLCIPCWR